MSAVRMMRQTINARIEKYGSLRAAARALGIDPGYLSKLHTGAKKNPSRETLTKLGLVRVEVYQSLKGPMK